MNRYDEAAAIMQERFGHDSLIALATVKDGRPYVRTVDSLYEDGAFYTVTYALSNKMAHIAAHPEVAISGEWFTAHGLGENLGHPRDEKNVELMVRLRAAFAAWYENGHTDENDPNTCILCVRLTDGVLANQGTWYGIDFVEKTAKV